MQHFPEASGKLNYGLHVMDYAAGAGHLDIVQHISVLIRLCSTKAMDNAAANGHWDIVKWLHENRTEGCSKNVIDLAAGNNHFEIVQWLQEQQLGTLSTKAMDQAAKRGHLEMGHCQATDPTHLCEPQVLLQAFQVRALKLLQRADRCTT
ncbi:Aste57867_16599 [Aphanomyces stellatus]|uniref:Aste57867_16599 protein n=1 Tax=Aphanomyces stellatus TaxID=120398 RepID=A0A485L7R1_9STRA|nr:hypothetical protein As57867_016542 [Aphanomyces stellatus]VFT93370.1 Aste57867_16599 [Aphanomyces stellatus]